MTRAMDQRSQPGSTRPGGTSLPWLLSWATLAAGVIALLAAAPRSMHLVATVVGIAGMGLGAWAQLISEVRPQRFVNCIGATAALVGAAFGFNHGGFIV